MSPWHFPILNLNDDNNIEIILIGNKLVYSFVLESRKCELQEINGLNGDFDYSQINLFKANNNNIFLQNKTNIYQLDSQTNDWSKINVRLGISLVGNQVRMPRRTSDYSARYYLDQFNRLSFRGVYNFSEGGQHTCNKILDTQLMQLFNLVEIGLKDNQTVRDLSCFNFRISISSDKRTQWFINNGFFGSSNEQVVSIVKIEEENLQPWRITISKNQILDLQEDAQGNVWFATEKDLRLYRLENWGQDEYESINSSDLGLSGTVIDIHESKSRNLWFASENEAVQVDPNTRKPQVKISAPAKTSITKVYQDRNDLVWLATTKGIYVYSPQGSYTLRKGITIKEPIQEIREDETGNIWFLGQGGETITRIDPQILLHGDRKLQNQATWSLSASELQGVNALTFPDAEGAIWLATDQGFARQWWNSEGIPSRRELIPFIDYENWLSAVSPINGQDFVVWRTRLTGLLKSAATEAESAAYPAPETVSPVTVLEAAPKGGVWVGRIFEGITLRDLNGTPYRLKDSTDSSQPLRHNTVLDIAQRPNINQPEAWIATNSGAMRVVKDGDRLKLVSNFAETSSLGPVDAIVALPDGSAYLALNPIEPILFRDGIKARDRSSTRILHISPDGNLSEPIQESIEGDIRDMVFDPKDKTIWIGTSNGLYKLQDNMLEPVRGGNVPQLPIRNLTVDPTGTIWMGVDGQDNTNSELGAKISPAQIVGYAPDRDKVTFYTEAEGLPRVTRIASLDTTPQGKLAAMVEGQLIKGYAYVPRNYTLIVILSSVAASIVATIGFGKYRQYKAKLALYEPLLNDSEKFFRPLPQFQEIRRYDYRTLQLLPKSNPQRDDQQPVGDNPTSPVPVRGALGDLLPVEEVIDVFKDLPSSNSEADRPQESFLVYPRELDPAASRQLDVYRLRGQATIIPISLSFLRTKIGEGSDKIREAFDGLRRRYLGRRDLFKARNAIDEPRFFFGRRALIDELFQALNKGEHVTIIGLRKSGKSSLLNMLRLRLEAFPVVFIDFQFYRRDEPNWSDEFLRKILTDYDEWGKARYENHWQPPTVAPEQGMNGTIFRDALRARRSLCQQQGNFQPLIILLDELERVFPQSDLNSEQVRAQAERFIKAAGILRALGQEGGNKLISLVIADLKPTFNRVNVFSVANLDTNPFYRFFQEYFLPPLDATECKEMLEEIGHAMGLTVTEEAITWLYENSGGYPALTRQLASAAYEQKSEGEEPLSVENCQKGYEKLDRESGDVDTFFSENLWQQASYAEKRVLTLAATETGIAESSLTETGPHPYLEDQLPPNEPQCSRKSLLEAQRLLISTGNLEPYGNGYRVRGILIRSWLQENVVWNEN